MLVTANVIPFFEIFGKKEGCRLEAKVVKQFIYCNIKQNKLNLINIDLLLTGVLFRNHVTKSFLKFDDIFKRMLTLMYRCHGSGDELFVVTEKVLPFFEIFEKEEGCRLAAKEVKQLLSCYIMVYFCTTRN